MEQHANQFALLRQRRFAPFFWTQFAGAMNDNVFKISFTLLVTFRAAELTTLDPKLLVNLIAGLFILPFVLFSATAGQLADKLEKSRLIRFVKLLEIAIMTIGAFGFFGRHIALLYTALFLMGLHSTLFGPVKYAYLPQHLKPQELVGGNGLVESGTFIAILLGTIVGGTLIARGDAGPMYAAVAVLAIALAGYAVSRLVPNSPAADPGLAINWNPFSETWKNLKFAKRNRTVFLSLLGISWLWFFGATFLTQFATFSKDVLGGDEDVVTLLLAVFSVGIGIGSLLCEKLSGDKVEIGLVPFGSIGMSVFAVDLYLASRGMAPIGTRGIAAFLAEPANWRVMADLALLAMFGGFYSVPLYALIQSRCEPSHRSRIIAANNILNAALMVASAVLAIVLLGAGVSIPQLFLLTGLLNAVVAIYIYALVPEFLMRFLAWLLIHSIYRLRTEGLDRIPDDGPAIVVCNHVSFVDAVVIAGACRRPIRFVMDHAIFKVPLLSFIFRTMRAIPIAPEKVDGNLKERAFNEVAQALRAGEVVGLFPEGKITDNGELHSFRPGITRIVKDTPAPVVPMALRGLWGSFFSRKGGPAMSKPFQRGIWSKIALVVGPPVMPELATPEHLHRQVAALRGDWR